MNSVFEGLNHNNVLVALFFRIDYFLAGILYCERFNSCSKEN